jgi:hypothetical protein
MPRTGQVLCTQQNTDDEQRTDQQGPSLWLSRLITTACKSGYQKRRCDEALVVVLQLLQSKVSGAIKLRSSDEMVWRRVITVRLLHATWSEFTKNTPTACDHFWIRRVVSVIIKHLHSGYPFGLPKTPAGADCRAPRLRLTTEHRELLRDITRELQEWMSTCNVFDHRCIGRFIATYPVWDIRQLDEITPGCLQNWFQYRVEPQGRGVGILSIVQRFLVVWHNKRGGPVRVVNKDDRKQQEEQLYHPLFPTDLPMHVAVFWGFYFRRPCVDFVRRLHHHFDSRHLKGTHRSQMHEAIKGFVYDFCASRGYRGDDWEEVVAPTIGTADMETWLHTQTALRHACGVGGGKHLPTVVVRYIVAMNHFRDLMFGCKSGAFTRLQILRTGVPTAGVIGPPPAPMCTYTHREVDGLFRACLSKRDRLLLLILTRVGLRNTALRTLKLANMSTGDEGAAFEKGGRWHRFYIDPQTRECMNAYLAHEHPSDSGTVYLFPHHTDHGIPMPLSQLRSWLAQLATRASISGQHVTVHSFRRYVVTTLLESRNSMEYVSRYIGHMSANTTSRYWITSPLQLVSQMNIPWSRDAGCQEDTTANDTVMLPWDLLQEAQTLLVDDEGDDA